MDALIRIKRLAVARRVEFTLKAEIERLRDSIEVEDVLESLVNANAIKKVIRSTSSSPIRGRSRDLLYIIESPTFSGTWIYTKGTFRRKAGKEVFYVFISAKIAE